MTSRKRVMESVAYDVATIADKLNALAKSLIDFTKVMREERDTLRLAATLLEGNCYRGKHCTEPNCNNHNSARDLRALAGDN